MQVKTKYIQCILLFGVFFTIFAIFVPSVQADDFEPAEEYIPVTSSTGFTIDVGDEAGGSDSIVLQFGSALAKTLSYDIDNTRFVFNDNLRIEGNNSIIGQLYIANDHSLSDSDGILNLGLNNSVFESIKWDDLSDYFSISDDIALNLHELIEARIENLSSAPTCDGLSRGRLYYNSGNNNSYVCNGLSWTQIDGGGSSGGAVVTIGEFYDGTGGMNVNTATPAAIPWNTEVRKDDGISHSTSINNSRVILDGAGWYKVAYNISHENQTTGRKNVRCRARLNGSTFVIPSNSYSYSRNTTDEWATNTAIFIFETTSSNEYYEVMCNREGSARAANTVMNESWTIVEKIGGTPVNPVILDDAYNNDSGERAITVDDGNITWNISGVYNFIINLLGTGNSFIVNDETNDTTPFIIDDAGNVGIGTTNPNSPLDIEKNLEVLELGDSTANDIIVNFDDGADRNLGWDDSESSFSTFDNQLRFRTRQSATPPVSCTALVAGMQWFDTDTGMLYICDTSNSRNKWLSPQDIVIWGEETGYCAAGEGPNNEDACTVDIGGSLGTDSNGQDLGFYLPHPITITGYGFSEDNDACRSGSFDLEVWSSGSNTNENSFTLESTVASGLTGQAHNANNLNINVSGNQYIIWGIDNNCGQTIDDFNMILYFRWRHD